MCTFGTASSTACSTEYGIEYGTVYGSTVYGSTVYAYGTAYGIYMKAPTNMVWYGMNNKVLVTVVVCYFIDGIFCVMLLPTTYNTCVQVQYTVLYRQVIIL